MPSRKVLSHHAPGLTKKQRIRLLSQAKPELDDHGIVAELQRHGVTRGYAASVRSNLRAGTTFEKHQPWTRNQRVLDAVRRWKGHVWQMPGLNRSQRIRALLWVQPNLSGARIQRELGAYGVTLEFAAQVKSRIRRDPEDLDLPIAKPEVLPLAANADYRAEGISDNERARRLLRVYPYLSSAEAALELHPHKVNKSGFSKVKKQLDIGKAPHLDHYRRQPRPPKLKQVEIVRRILDGEHYHVLPGMSRQGRIVALLQKYPSWGGKRIVDYFSDKGIEVNQSDVSTAKLWLRKNQADNIPMQKRGVKKPKSKTGRAREALLKNPTWSNARLVAELRPYKVTMKDAARARVDLKKEGHSVSASDQYDATLTSHQVRLLQKGRAPYKLPGLSKTQRIRFALREHPDWDTRRIREELKQYRISTSHIGLVRKQLSGKK